MSSHDGAPGDVDTGPDLRRRWTADAPVSGTLIATRDYVFATVDERRDRNAAGVPHGHPEQYGVAAFDRETGEPSWDARNQPGLAFADDGAVYAYARTGVVVCFEPSGEVRWRAEVEDDRSEAGAKRGDATAPFAPDLVALPSGVYLPAGSSVYRLSARDGKVTGRAEVCGGAARRVVARLASVSSSGTLIATCAERTDYDDERATPEGPALHAPRPTLSELRDGPAELVGLDLELGELWRAQPGRSDNRRPADAGDGTIVHALRTEREAGGRTELAGTWLRIDAKTGGVLARHTTGGGDPIVLGNRVLLDDYLYDLESGTLLSHLDQAWGPRSHPAVVGDELFSATRGHVWRLAAGDDSLDDLGTYVRRVARPNGSLYPVSHRVAGDLAVADGVGYVAIDGVDGRAMIAFELATAH